MNIEGSSLRKGESLFDTAQTLGAMNPDLVIIRHGENDASKEIAKILECPVINAGEGVNEHPTQALLDAYTIMNHNRKLNDITVSICGDLEHSRVARSNYYLLNKMKSKVRFVFPDYFKPKDLDKYDVETFTNLEEGIKDADIVMMLRIQNERIKDLNLPSADDYFRSFGLTYEKLKLAKPEVLVLHPGPINRGVEIENELADDVNKSVITEQVENGVAVRMACLSIMVNDIRDNFNNLLFLPSRSIPTGILVSRLFNLGELKSIGSGNIGATNVLRTETFQLQELHY